MSRLATALAIAAFALNAGACISVTTPRFMLPAPERDWPTTLDRARALAAQGNVLAADSLLAQHASKYPRTPGAVESYYWRSLMLVQSGAAPTPGPAMMLGLYLGERDIEHRIEAQALLRAAMRVDSLTLAATSLANKVNVSHGEVATANTRTAEAKSDVKAVTAETKDQDAEIRKLRAELAASKEELERIKKRLAEPPKKPPRE
ncbi:MAG TPA: hypothetical protein VFO55_02930 [Gemmatimonadaceae bacterium]|nr:hypothetical protein [Gemmatimonadaceae bacterium]